jgi:hypothetical protein
LGEFLFNFLVTLSGRLAISNLIGWDDLEANQLIACKVGEMMQGCFIVAVENVIILTFGTEWNSMFFLHFD